LTFNNLTAIILLVLLSISSVNAQVIEIGTISITGNKRTKDFVILREMVLGENQKVSQDSLSYLLEMSNNRVMNLNLFNAVKLDTSYLENKLQIQVTLVEKWFNWPIPFVEFSDRNFNIWKDLSFDPTRTNYGVYLFNYNVWGRNHTLKTSLVYGYNKTYGVEYRIPFLSKSSSVGISSTLKYTSQSEIWLNTKNDELEFFKNGTSNLIEKKVGTIRFNKRITPYTMAYANLGVTQTKLDSSLLGIASHYLLDNRLDRTQLEVGASLENDRRNNIYLPTTGTFFRGGVNTEYFNGKDPICNVYISGKVQTFNNLSNNWFAALSLFGDLNTARELPYENSRRFGYKNLVRGFETYVIEGQSSVLANAAIRYQLLDKKRLEFPFIPINNYNFLPVTMLAEFFADGGYVRNSRVLTYNILPNALLYSTGISLQTVFYNDRILRLEYSLNSLKESGFFVHFKKAI
jgi:outer membrane protein assembly factor BamA